MYGLAGNWWRSHRIIVIVSFIGFRQNIQNITTVILLFLPITLTVSSTMSPLTADTFTPRMLYP
jgi:hypothetical protein